MILLENKDSYSLFIHSNIYLSGSQWLMSLILALRQVDLSEFRLVTGLKEFQTRQS